MPVKTDPCMSGHIYKPSRPLAGTAVAAHKSTNKELDQARERIKELTAHIERQDFESKLLREINTGLTSTFELSEILSLILQVLTTLVNAQGVSILLVQESDKTLRIAESHGLSSKDIENFYIFHARINEGIFAKIMQEMKPYFLEQDEELSMPLLLSVPLISRARVIGFLNIHTMYKNKPLTKEKYELVYTLASQASIAIMNAQMYASMREQAIIDQCTGLFNFRYFQQKLDEEIETCLKNGEPLSLIILDIDHFKKVNDTWGHLYGDQVLRELANLLSRNVRTEDSVCRYGGEEFAVIFPRCDLGVSGRIAERIRSRIQETSGQDRRSIFKESITVSIGVAQFKPETNKTVFIQEADSALYWAKNHGRNQVHIYDPRLEDEYQK